LINQDESIATPAPKIFKENCSINWNEEAIKIHNFIRGLSPNPCAFTLYDDKILKIFESKISDQKSNSEPGEISILNKNIFVNTKDLLLEILDLQLEGKKRLKSSKFVNSIPKGKKNILT
jgi:methionyl-tRNA formyltransferase